ncbi:MAG: protein-glutamate O-methyltransferase CheR [Bacteroidales bacterium]|jgi:chemotaxis protein methyltransferase CheR|nr:protein-glutamate O-methyltransferase CheR [Bacteroidales bacterium]
MKNQKLKDVLNLLHEQRGFDFSGYRISMLERRVQKRVFATHSKDLNEYITFLNHHPDEFDNLIDVFTINVSRFFRNSLSFEYITKIIIPNLFLTKTRASDDILRIWSAGCSFGEEPYSIAIILNELLKKEESNIKPTIFATDIDKKAIARAAVGTYGFESIKKVKYGILEKYFTKEESQFKLNQEIKNRVQFSFYDMLDKNRAVPPESIFGGFDLILCRNVLIYFEPEFQKIIFNKLYKSLNKNGYLILGEAEVPIDEFKHKFKRENKCSKIYRKIG